MKGHKYPLQKYLVIARGYQRYRVVNPPSSRYLRSPINVFFNEHINLFEIVPIINNLDMMAMMTKMNAGPLARFISMNVKYPWVAHYNTLRRLLANLAVKSGSKRRRSTNKKGFLGEAIKFHIIQSRHLIGALKVIALWVLALQVTDANGQTKCEVQIIANVGGQSLGLNMTIIALIHSIYKSGLGVYNCVTNWREVKHVIIVKARG